MYLDNNTWGPRRSQLRVGSIPRISYGYAIGQASTIVKEDVRDFISQCTIDVTGLHIRHCVDPPVAVLCSLA